MIIKNVNIITSQEILKGYDLEIENGKIKNIQKDIKKEATIDGKGLYLSPGFVDMHVHGGGGYDFMDDDEKAYEKITYAHMIHGTTSMLPTLLPSDDKTLIDSIKRYLNAKNYYANLLGIHLEGPFLNKEQKGAINSSFILNPSIEKADELLKVAAGSISRMTIAPELDNASSVIRYLKDNNVIVSIGHSNANLDQVREAYKNGANLITHFYSACSSIMRENGFRKCGVVESGYLIDDMNIEIIADGVHLPLDLIKYICKFKDLNHIALVTDAMRAAGTNLKETYLGTKENGTPCIIEDGVAKLKDRSAFAGSIATSDRLLRTMLECGVDMVDAVKMVTVNPIKMLGSNTLKGEIKVGYDADLVLFDKNINIQTVIINGEVLYKK